MKKIVVLMSTYNGEKYLDEQILSLVNQIGVEIMIFVRDDGSIDDTINILNKWKNKGVLLWYDGENFGPALSFMNLVENAPNGDYYAFCDQDDVWDKNKLEIASSMLSEYNEEEFSLYFSNKRLVNRDLDYIRETTLKTKITLGSALAINPVTGCTLVINHKLISYIKKYKNENMYMHDGWIYRVCMALNGHVVFDNNSYVSYRQHENNVIGGTSSFYKKWKRRISNGVLDRKRIREKDAIELLNGYSELMEYRNLEQIMKIANYRNSFLSKMNLILDKRFRTGCLEYDLSFICAIILGSL